ncbi:MAG: helix-turn-helix transcriptional regulator [Candidatus Aenigmatarchaeota archaeon]
MVRKLNSKHLGAVLLTISILMGVSFFLLMDSINKSEREACELKCDGTHTESCPMTDSMYEKTAYYFSSSFIILVLLTGAYLLFSKPENFVLGDETKFDIVLSMLNDDEKEVIKAVKEQEGIKQSTLKYRVDFSKAKLSNLLKQLEKRGLLKREESGKTYKVFLGNTLVK